MKAKTNKNPNFTVVEPSKGENLLLCPFTSDWDRGCGYGRMERRKEELGLWNIGQVDHAVGREERGRTKIPCTEPSETSVSGETKKEGNT